MSDTTDFFDTDPDGKLIYTNRRHIYQAPEEVYEFDSRFASTVPGTDKRIAFGFMRSEGNSEWRGTGMVDHDWVRYGPWKIKEN